METLFQTKAKSGQDILNYPIRLNDKLSAVFDAANSGYIAPSRQVRDVYDVLAAQIDEQLNAFKSIKSNDVKAFNATLKQKDVPVLYIKE